MGADNGFHKKVRRLKHSINPSSFQAGDYVLIDGSCDIHAVNANNPNIASRLFWIGKDSEDLDMVVDEYSDLLLERFIIPMAAACEVVFECSTNKPVNALRMRRRAGPLNSAIRHFFSSRKSINIGKYMGRPPLWLMRMISDRLRDKGVTVTLLETTQADSYIVCKSRQLLEDNHGQRCVVVSADYDYLVFAYPGTIAALIDKCRNVYVNRAEVMECFPENNEEQLFLAYCAGGCDDISTKLSNVGFSKALRIVSESALTFASSQTQFVNAFKGFGTAVETSTLYKEIWNMKSTYWYSDLKILESSADVEMQSMFHIFANEESSSGILRRPGLKKLCDQYHRNPNLHLAECVSRSRKSEFEARSEKLDNKKLIPISLNYYQILNMADGATASAPGLMSSKVLKPKQPRQFKAPKARPQVELDVLDARQLVQNAKQLLSDAKDGADSAELIMDLTMRKRMAEDVLLQANSRAVKSPRTLGPIKSEKLDMIRNYNPTTIDIGMIKNIINPLLKDDRVFQEYYREVLMERDLFWNHIVSELNVSIRFFYQVTDQMEEGFVTKQVSEYTIGMAIVYRCQQG
jgi:hypothetical protein